MNKVSWKYIKWSLWICLVLPFIIPSSLNTDGKNSFLYGLPFSYVTIYQENPNSGWFFDNFFNGNHGLAINPSTLVINVIIIYLLISFIRRLSKENSQKVKL